MISGMVIDLCLCIRLLIPALGLRSLQYRLLLVVGDRMPVNDQTVELKTQELVFIGNMFVDPPQMARYATFVETNHMISTEPAKSIWRALYLYYTPEGSTQKEAIVRLKDICPRDSDTPITSWAAGTKYIYEISMRLDGGVLVTVETTDWGETIEAETPGLLIQ